MNKTKIWSITDTLINTLQRKGGYSDKFPLLFAGNLTAQQLQPRELTGA